MEPECRDSARDVLRVCRDAQHERMPSLGWCIAEEGLSSCDEAEWWLDEGMWLEDDSSDYVYESPSEDSAEGEEWDSDCGSEISEGGVSGP